MKGSIDFVNFFFQRMLGVNKNVPWSVHFTSVVISPENISMTKSHNLLKSFSRSPGCYIQATNGIVFDKDVLFGPGVKIISANHDFDNLRAPALSSPSIKIGPNCWIGANAVLLPGVSLGEHCIVGAGSVVTHSFPEHVVIGGNPARFIRSLKSGQDLYEKK